MCTFKTRHSSVRNKNKGRKMSWFQIFHYSPIIISIQFKVISQAHGSLSISNLIILLQVSYVLTTMIALEFLKLSRLSSSRTFVQLLFLGNFFLNCKYSVQWPFLQEDILHSVLRLGQYLLLLKFYTHFFHHLFIHSFCIYSGLNICHLSNCLLIHLSSTRL